MPGFFGSVGLPGAEAERLATSFAAAWGTCDQVRLDGDVRLGGHAHAGRHAVAQIDDFRAIAIDGELSIYLQLAAGELLSWFRDGKAHFADLPDCRGNVAAVDAARGQVVIATESTGSFPVYFVRIGRGLAFSSRLSPIQALVHGSADPIALLSFVRKGYIQTDRSFIDGVRRLQPGQALEFSERSGEIRIRERSDLWVGWSGTAADHQRGAAEEGWNRLQSAVSNAPVASRCGVMVSGGWDSRTLLGAAKGESSSAALVGYSHGDPGSREIAIARAVARAAGIELHQEPIGADIYRLSDLRRVFAREETVVFPHWAHAGVALAGLGAKQVMAGVYGEVLGGHYGRAMLLRGSSKIIAVGASLLGINEPIHPVTDAELSSLKAFLRVGPLRRPWFLAADYWASIDRPVQQLNADIEQDIARLRGRNVHSLEQLIESYVTELRGSQYINAQLRSCRAELDISIPFADQQLLAFASRLPLSFKIHNAINRAALRHHWPALLDQPLAATLVRARAPLLVQEASRLARKVREEGHWKLHFASSGRIPPPRLAWVNFEFLREGRCLHEVIDDLRADVWDRGALQRKADAVTSREFRQPVHPVSDLLMKIYTIDLVLRGA